jgi:biopolymer transport protein ExbB
MKRLLSILALLMAHAASAQGLDNLATGAAKDLQKSLEDLSALRGRIETEKLPLAREVNRLEQDLIDRRTELQKLERFQENTLVELNDLKARARARGEEFKYLDSLLGEYSRSFRTRLHIIEEPRFKELFARIDKAGATPDLAPSDRITQRSELIQESIKRLRAAAGGDRFEAEVLTPSGKLEKGAVALLGPVALYAGSTPELTGLVQQELNKADPTLFQFTGGDLAGVRALATTGTGTLELDPSLGNAVKIASINETVWEHTKKGGTIIWPMLALALASLVVGIYKWIQISRFKVVRQRDLEVVLQKLVEGEPKAAFDHASKISGPAGELLRTAIEHADEKKEYIEEVLYEKMLAAKPVLESYLPFISLTAAAAPLLGLLGTVTGMITTFNMISLFGTGDPRTMSSGISEALITTEYGLVISIPALLLHAFLSRRVKSVLGSMEQSSISFINGLPENAAVALNPFSNVR